VWEQRREKRKEGRRVGNRTKRSNKQKKGDFGQKRRDNAPEKRLLGWNSANEKGGQGKKKAAGIGRTLEGRDSLSETQG